MVAVPIKIVELLKYSGKLSYMKKILFAVFVFLCLPVLLNLSKAYGDSAPALLVFHSPSCHRCVEVKKDILPQIEKEYKDSIQIKYYDITDVNNYALVLALKDKYNKDFEFSLPVFFINGRLINGKGDVKSNLKIAIDVSLGEAHREEGALEADLISRFSAFKPLAIVGAGLTDGINPCAFTVIVFFISYLALQGYRKLELIVIGLSFIFSVFCTYLLIGLGIFNFLYRLEGFWILAKVFNISIGILSLILGALALYDLVKFRKTKSSEGMLLQLPQVVKNQIHSIIGMHYRKDREADTKKTTSLRLARLVLSALITGFLVSILEAVCTGQMYLPTITFILKTTTLKLKAFTYLLVYNIMFIIPLVVIFLLALFGVTSQQFAQFIRKHMVSIKLLMAVVFISLGVLLVWRG
jgi:cytochrome c biogenesis protein CcdA/glutaredoxin